MVDLHAEFAALIESASQGHFEAQVRRSVLSNAEARLHPLNFVAIRTDDGAGTGLRLHLWDQRFSFGQTGFEVHDHTFDLDSYVVEGKVEQIIYTAEPDPAGEYVTFHVQYLGHGSSLRASEQSVLLRELDQSVFSQGEQYRLSHGVLHSLVPVSPFAATLVLTHEQSKAAVTVGPLGSPKEVTATRQALRDSQGAAYSLSSSTLAEIVEAAVATRNDLDSESTP